jgi:hypothetical protein
MTHFAELDNLLKRKNQRFICIDTGWPKPGPDRHIAQITHETTPPLSKEEIAKLKSQLPEVPKLVDLYSSYGSIRLYCDSVFYAPWDRYSSAFYIAHPDEWPDLKDYFSGWLDDLSEEEEQEFLPDWIEDYVVIGEIPNSGNYFLVPLQGMEAGCVYEFEHDGFEFIKQADTLTDFIVKLCTVTDSLISEIRGHTRYFDGKTDTQWLAERYEFD